MITFSFVSDSMYSLRPSLRFAFPCIGADRARVSIEEYLLTENKSASCQVEITVVREEAEWSARVQQRSERESRISFPAKKLYPQQKEYKSF